MKNYRIRENGLISTWLKLQESGTPADFPKVMADVQHKILLKAFLGFPSPWKDYAKAGEVSDFKSHNRAWLGEAQDLKPKKVGGGYHSTPLSDYGYAILAETKGRTFMLTRETVINDDLDAFKEVPAKLGRAAARTVGKSVAAILETNATAYDGNALFTTGHANMSSTALTADATGIAAVQAGMKAIRTATDPSTSEIMGLEAKILLVSPTLEETANWLVSQTEVRHGSSSGLTSNPLKGRLKVVVDPFLTVFPSRWYLLADPAQAHAVEVAFLNGKQEPDVLVKKADAAYLSGGSGDDEFGFSYDDIEYKVRHDWGVKAAFYQAAYKGGS